MPASGPGEPERARRQTWSAETYKANAGFVADLGAGVLDWLAPQRDERILDLGCGDGRLTAKIAESGAVVVGADASAPLLAAARKLGIETHRVDGHQLHFEREFDAVFPMLHFTG